VDAGRNPRAAGGKAALFGNQYFLETLPDLLPEGAQVRVRYDLPTGVEREADELIPFSETVREFYGQRNLNEEEDDEEEAGSRDSSRQCGKQ
jgi:hypothetical protein